MGACLCLAFATTGWAQKPPPDKPAAGDEADKPPPDKPPPDKPPPDKPPAAKPQPPPEGAAPATEVDEPPPVTPEMKEKAKQHFLTGLRLLREEAWAPALASFKLSRELFPTRVATHNAAIALRKLERYDEALDMFETLLRDFKVSESDRKSAQSQIAELRELVGTIDITGAEPGASIVISSQGRGEYPPVKPIRVPAGNHVVRLFKEGFEPFESKIDVAGGQTAFIKAKMPKLKKSGRLRVAERTGKTVQVLVDNVVVGQTPWIGPLSVGDHMVTLQGEGKLGTQPTAAPVKADEVTNLTLVAEPLEASLRVDPTPPGASVWINSVNVGRGVWLGRLKVGKHKVEAKQEGFLTAAKEVTLQQGVREAVALELERDEDAAIWQLPPKWTMDVETSFLVVPTFGGKVAGDCSGDCARAIGIGGQGTVHASYELGSGLGFGLELGYLAATQDVEQRKAEQTPNGFTAANLGSVDDSLRLTGFMAGARIGYHLGESYPVIFRLGAGALIGQIRDERKGTFDTQDGNTYEAYPVVDFQSAYYFYIDPGIRAGVRFAEHFELTGSVKALMLIALEQPKWDSTIELNADTDGLGTYGEDALLGTFVIMIAPGVNLRYDF